VNKVAEKTEKDYVKQTKISKLDNTGDFGYYLPLRATYQVIEIH